jgi:predicted kinase
MVTRGCIDPWTDADQNDIVVSAAAAAAGQLAQGGHGVVFDALLGVLNHRDRRAVTAAAQQALARSVSCQCGWVM